MDHTKTVMLNSSLFSLWINLNACLLKKVLYNELLVC